MSSPEVDKVSLKSQYGKFLADERIRKELAAFKPEKLPDNLKPPPGAPAGELPKRREDDEPVDLSESKVCIVGAGVAGLYAARMLDYCGIKYDLYEASRRPGGRVFTHYFSHDKPHDYYDIGAMRFPDTPIMARTFELFDELDVPTKKYYMQSAEGWGPQPSHYNDRTKFLSKEDEEKLLGKVDFDPFCVSEKHGGPVPDATVLDPASLLNDAYAVYLEKIKRNPANGFKYLMRHDKYSLRGYLDSVEDLDYESIHWLETLYSATGWFDLSFSENIMEDLAFDWGKNALDPKKTEDVKWKCVNGGTQVLIDKMVKQWKININYNTRVTSIALERKDQGENEMVVKYLDPTSEETKTKRYATVINTTTLAAMRQMDLTGLELSYATKTAIRCLRYDTSTKVAIKFRKAWWMQDPFKIRGGLGKTDLPLRVCVYPSYNVDDPDNESAVLLCSYTWGQDSERIASMVNRESPKCEDSLKALMLDNLARLHTRSLPENKAEWEKEYKELLDKITDLYDTHHAYDWSTDPYAAGGAFALFGPGQFSKLYPHIIRPSSDSRFHIVGEHASVHHAWIAGALNSAYRGVYMFFERFNLKDKQKELKRKFGIVNEIDYDSAYVQSEIGKLKPNEQPKLSL